MSVLITGATIIDGVADTPIHGQCLWVEDSRIKAIGRREDFGGTARADVFDARGRFVIPGLLNANVHLLCDIRLENLARHADRYEQLICEAAQLALKNGVTTVFDTWGPRRFLMAVRDRINARQAQGSRIFCAGNIVGLDGPFSHDFIAKSAEMASAALVRRINAIWAENVGRHLMWLPPDHVAREVRTYLGKGIDFLKYASNGHGGAHNSAFIAFSPEVQARIVDETHRAGLTAQAHTMSVEGLRIAVEAGCDLIQHANLTGPVPIPEETLELLAKRKTGAVIFPFTQSRFEAVMRNGSDADRTMWQASDANARRLIRCGAPLLAATDGFVWSAGMAADPMFNRSHLAPGEDNLFDLSSGHFAWFRAMEEKGCPPMEMLRAATRNIAVAYGRSQNLGTLEPGKVADLLILDKDPLQSAANYRSIHAIFKDGALVDRDALPLEPMLTKPTEPAAEESSYIQFLSTATSFPVCPCVWRA